MCFRGPPATTKAPEAPHPAAPEELPAMGVDVDELGPSLTSQKLHQSSPIACYTIISITVDPWDQCRRVGGRKRGRSSRRIPVAAEESIAGRCAWPSRTDGRPQMHFAATVPNDIWPPIASARNPLSRPERSSPHRTDSSKTKINQRLTKLSI
jgi:hypothetical protein